MKNTIWAGIAFVLLTSFGVQAQQSTQIQVSGDTTEFGRLVTDGKLDFALITPSLTRADLLNFDLSNLISPQSDRIKVLTQTIDLPSNIALPQQKERYSLFSFELNKPGYRTFIKQPGQYTFSALHGQFPVKNVIDDIRGGKSIFEVVNYFNFLGFGQFTANVAGEMPGQNIAVNQYQFSQVTSVTAPPLKSDQTMLALSMSDVDGLLSPVDLKRLKSTTSMDLKVSPLGKPYVVSLIMENPKNGEKMPSFDKLSFSILPAELSKNPTFLDYVAAPVVTDTEIQMTPPALAAPFQALGMYITYSEIKKIDTGSVSTEERRLLWESWDSEWKTSIPKPALDIVKNPDLKYRWEVMFLAKDQSFIIMTNGDILNQVTHVTRNIVEE